MPPPGASGEREEVFRRLRAMTFELADLTYESYAVELQRRGGIVEERIAGEDLRSPSVQLRVTPLGKVELLSTHDQLLGGPGGPKFLGCRFPTTVAYAPAIPQKAANIGRRLAKEGVLGRFAIDFVVVRRQEDSSGGPSGPPSPLAD